MSLLLIEIYSETSETDDNYSEHIGVYTKNLLRYSAFSDYKHKILMKENFATDTY